MGQALSGARTWTPACGELGWLPTAGRLMPAAAAVVETWAAPGSPGWLLAARGRGRSQMSPGSVHRGWSLTTGLHIVPAHPTIRAPGRVGGGVHVHSVVVPPVPDFLNHNMVTLSMK